ncbi:LytTR family two component transcriptional regulator [Marinilabilia salmonicolor]|jgi:DNA-binding LytR/AlgR family response regulator|uniref:LytR/AlgR family response regulator transcription factor n=1 Tax=Marinilabilia salmonicolor TaxID=989 RepID=UPI000D07F835|nr:LytTR family DNA-binding domain-containing protein [Marinilabilia salmonicolor]PRY99947.1 LytTR family two component transcriptional regulator [Marinilabilia salmonicolor]
MKVLIIEDEKWAADKLESMLRIADPGIEILAKLGSVNESVKWFLQNKADLIFLDIQLSDGSSFSIFEQVSVSTPVIFTTAYDQYAIKAFQVNSISYLLKPVRQSDLNQSLQKFRNLKSAFSIDFDALLSQIKGKQPDYKKRFLIQIGEKIRKVEVAEIAYFYIFDKGVYLRTFQGNNYPLDYSLDRLENLINPDNFFRINRKYMVSMDAISNMTAYSRGRVKLELTPSPVADSETIVSVDRSLSFKKWLNK